MQRGTRLLILAGVLFGVAGLCRWLAHGVALGSMEEAAPDAAAEAEQEQPTAPIPDTQPVSRSPTADVVGIPGGSGAILRVRVTDPLGLLDHKHRLLVVTEGVDYRTDYLREDEFLVTRLKADIAAPRAVRLAIGRPSDLIPLAEAPITQQGDGSFFAEVDLSNAATVVELRLHGTRELLDQIRVELNYRTMAGKERQVLPRITENHSLVAVVPVPGGLQADCRLPGTDHLQRTLIPITVPGEQTHEIDLASGSLRVLLPAEHFASEWRASEYELKLSPETGSDDFLEMRRAKFADGEASFRLLPPGRYRLNWTWSIGNGERLPLVQRLVEIGANELTITLEDPENSTDLLVRFDEGPPPTITAKCVGASEGMEHEGILFVEQEVVALFRLAGAKWSLVARRGEQVAFLQVDTRTQQGRMELRMEKWFRLTPIALTLTSSIAQGNVSVLVTDASGRSHQRRLGFRDGSPWNLESVPGLMHVTAMHHTGLVAESLLMIPEDRGVRIPFQVTLEFRAP